VSGVRKRNKKLKPETSFFVIWNFYFSDALKQIQQTCHSSSLLWNLTCVPNSE
jgi:hypothetical protein